MLKQSRQRSGTSVSVKIFTHLAHCQLESATVFLGLSVKSFLPAHFSEVVLTKSAHWLQLNREVPPSPVLTCPLHRVLALRLYSIKTFGEVITINEGNCEWTSSIAQIFVILWILALKTFQSNDHRELLLISGHVKVTIIIMIMKMRMQIITIIPVVTAMPRPQ